MSHDPDPPRILIIRRRYLGDLVMLGPFLSNLRRQWPGGSLTVLVDEGYADILALNPDVNRVLQIPRRLDRRRSGRCPRYATPCG